MQAPPNSNATLSAKQKNYLFRESFAPIQSLSSLNSAVKAFYKRTITANPKEWQEGCVRHDGKIEKLFVVGTESNHLLIVHYKTSGFGVFPRWDLFQKTPDGAVHIASGLTLAEFKTPTSLLNAVREHYATNSRSK